MESKWRKIKWGQVALRKIALHYYTLVGRGVGAGRRRGEGV